MVPSVPTPEECVRRAWERLCDANHSSAPLSTVAVLYAESQAWAALAVALGHVSPDVTSVGTTPVVPQGTSFNKPARDVASPKSKPGQSPKPKPEPAGDPMAQLRAKWQQEQADGA